MATMTNVLDLPTEIIIQLLIDLGINDWAPPIAGWQDHCPCWMAKKLTAHAVVGRSMLNFANSHERFQMIKKKYEYAIFRAIIQALSLIYAPADSPAWRTAEDVVLSQLALDMSQFSAIGDQDQDKDPLSAGEILAPLVGKPLQSFVQPVDFNYYLNEISQGYPSESGYLDKVGRILSVQSHACVRRFNPTRVWDAWYDTQEIPCDFFQTNGTILRLWSPWWYRTHDNLVGYDLEEHIESGYAVYDEEEEPEQDGFQDDEAPVRRRPIRPHRYFVGKRALAPPSYRRLEDLAIACATELGIGISSWRRWSWEPWWHPTPRQLKEQNRVIGHDWPERGAKQLDRDEVTETSLGRW